MESPKHFSLRNQVATHATLAQEWQQTDVTSFIGKVIVLTLTEYEQEQQKSQIYPRWKYVGSDNKIFFYYFIELSMLIYKGLETLKKC